MIYWLCHGLHSAVKKSRPDLKPRDSNFPGAGGLWPGHSNPPGISLPLAAVCASRAWLGAGSCSEHLECCGLCLHQRAEAAAKAPAPERLRALKIHSKAASNPPVFIINMTPFIRVHSSFCFLFLSLPFHCFPGASMGMAPKPRPGGRGSARSLPAAGIYSIKASSSNQGFVVVGFFFPPSF